MAPTSSPLTGSIIVLPWPDPALDAIGHDPRSPYVERFWLGVLGPSTTFLLRRLATEFDRAPDGYELDLPTVAASLGLTAGSPNGAFARALGRIVSFGLAHPHPHGLAVRRRVPPVGRRLLARLPDQIQAEHEALAGLHEDPGTGHRARVMARALLAGGVPPAQVARDLELVGVPRRLAEQAAGVDTRAA